MTGEERMIEQDPTIEQDRTREEQQILIGSFDRGGSREKMVHGGRGHENMYLLP
jgi:hypothetical protein